MTLYVCIRLKKAPKGEKAGSSGCSTTTTHVCGGGSSIHYRIKRHQLPTRRSRSSSSSSMNGIIRARMVRLGHTYMYTVEPSRGGLARVPPWRRSSRRPCFTSSTSLPRRSTHSSSGSSSSPHHSEAARAITAASATARGHIKTKARSSTTTRSALAAPLLLVLSRGSKGSFAAIITFFPRSSTL